MYKTWGLEETNAQMLNVHETWVFITLKENIKISKKVVVSEQGIIISLSN
jgi:hypothetical protein